MRLIVAIAFVGTVFLLTARQDQPSKAVAAKHGMVVCVSPPAALIGADVLKKGGNAVDAAIAVAFAMAVTHPSAGNIGGGGIMLIHPPQGAGNPTVIEYRETAPAAATADMFIKDRDEYSHRAVGVPGTVRGMKLAFQKHGSGKIKWADLIQPAIRLAADGWMLEAWSAESLNELMGKAKIHAECRRVFGKPGGQPWQTGDVLKQPDLAKTLQTIADRGADGFYTGAVADQIEAEMKRAGGLITKADLAAYSAKQRTPVRGTYRGYDIWGTPPPTSGGTCLIQMLNMLERFDMKALGPDSADRWHITAEVMRRAFVDRARYLGDSDFVNIPETLITKHRARTMAASIDLAKATSSTELAPDIPLTDEAAHTTHFSIVDSAGMAVANTYTLEESYGSRIVAPGTGFLLNNEMMDFNPIPGVTTTDGKIGTAANRVAPGKRMLSSMSPTILTKDGKVVLVTGSPGGRTIINTVLCIVTNVVDCDMDVQSAVAFPRLHHQWLPDQIQVEQLSSRKSLVNELERRGHRIIATSRPGTQGDAHTIWIAPDGTRYGAADHRLMGQAAGY